MPPRSETIRLPERATRGSRLKLLVLGDSHTATHALPLRGDVAIGRGDDADVQVNDRSISRRHAVLHLGDEAALEDLGSANGTWVRDRKLVPRETVPLAPGDVVELGATTLVLQREGDPCAVQAAPPAVQPPSQEGRTAMDRLLRLVDRVAQSTISVLLLGENGVGKEVLATRLQERSPRAHKPFVKLNCAALTESLLESELFGHERGAFNDAREKPGLFEAGDGGTVLLDEIGEMAPALQSKLLRVLEDKEVRRVGGLKPKKIDVRFISSTNRDLLAEIARGKFRQDLYFRLNGFALHIPPLRERRAEIPALVQHFIEEACRRDGRARRPSVSLEALGWLERQSWPGNVRELRNTIERAVLLCDGETLTLEHLPPDAERPPAPPLERGAPAADPAPATSLRSRREEAERCEIVQALERCRGNQTRAAELLGISRRTLIERLDRYGIPRPRKKKASATEAS